MAMLPLDTSEAAKLRKSAIRMEKCLFGQQELDVPEIMMEDVRFLCFVVSLFIHHKTLVLMAIKLTMLKHSYSTSHGFFVYYLSLVLFIS